MTTALPSRLDVDCSASPAGSGEPPVPALPAEPAEPVPATPVPALPAPVPARACAARACARRSPSHVVEAAAFGRGVAGRRAAGAPLASTARPFALGRGHVRPVVEGHVLHTDGARGAPAPELELDLVPHGLAAGIGRQVVDPLAVLIAEQRGGQPGRVGAEVRGEEDGGRDAAGLSDIARDVQAYPLEPGFHAGNAVDDEAGEGAGLGLRRRPGHVRRDGQLQVGVSGVLQEFETRPA